MTFDIKPLHPLFAAEVGGVDLAGDLDAPAVQAISDVIDRYAVLVFRGQRLSNDQQVAFARRFGEPEVSTQAFRKDEKLRVRPEMADVSNIGLDGKVRGRDDRQRMFSLGNQMWHTDSSFRRVTGALSMLHAHGAPPAEGKYERIRAAMGLAPGADLPAALMALNRELGMPRNLREMGVPPDCLPAMTAGAVRDHSSATNPRPRREEDYAALFAEAMDQ